MPIPEHTQHSIDMFVELGHGVGGFLTAVLTNDLFGAVAKADAESLEALGDIVRYIYNNVPQECYGSVDAVSRWKGRAHV